MSDQPQQLVDAIQVAQTTQSVIRQNIIFILAIKILFLVLASLGLASMWAAVFADVGLTVLAVLNAMRILRQ